MRTHISNMYSAATRINRELRFFPFSTGRPLFAVLAIAAAAIGMTILFFPSKPADNEPHREETIQLTGTVCGLEPRLQEDTVIWRMILSDVRIESPIGATDAEGADRIKTSSNGGDEAIRSAESDREDRGQADSNPENNAVENSTVGQIQSAFHLTRKDKVLCILDHEPEAEMSSRVCVRGKLFPFRGAMNEGEFDLRMYYHILRIEFSLRDVDLLAASAPTDRLAALLFHFKNHISSIIDRLFSKENSPILKAMLLGEKGMLEEETKELYQGAGIIHILSISGLHLSLLGMGIFSLTGKCRFIPLPVRAVLSIITIFLYGKMIGMGTSVFRALIMLTLYIISKVIGRTYDLLTAASIAAFLLLLDQPLYMLHTGFQFSFGAVLAIGILLPALPGRILKAAAIPLATLPVYLWAYGTFPITSLLLNLIVIPLMTVVMVSAAFAVFIEEIFAAAWIPTRIPARILTWIPTRIPIWIPTGIPRLVGLPAELILDFYRFLAQTSEKIPGHEIVLGRPSPIRILFFYCMLFVLSYISVRLQMPHMRRRIEAGATKDTAPGEKSPEDSRVDWILVRTAVKVCSLIHLKDNRERKIFACVCTAFWLAAALFILTFHRPPVFEMDVLYVGQGDGIFVSSEGRHFLIDGGSSTKEDLAKYTLIPFLHCKGVGRLDGIILSHDDTDHCSGLLESLEAAAEEKPIISISSVYLPDIAENAKGENYKRIEELSGQAGIPVQYISRGQRIRSGDLTMDCLHPAQGASYEDANEYSTTLLLRYGDSAKSQSESSGFEAVFSGKEKEFSGNTQDFSGKEKDLSGKAKVFSALLTGDLEGRGEEDLLQYLKEKYLAETNQLKAQEEALAEPDFLKVQEGKLNIDVLKVAHHGSKNSTSEEFLQVVHPDMALISAGIDNMYGHPTEVLLGRLETLITPSSIYRTDLQGEISIRCRKKRDDYQVKTFLEDSIDTSETLRK